jgi:hypothetical protein
MTHDNSTKALPPTDWTELFPPLAHLRRAEPVERYDGARDFFCTPDGRAALIALARRCAELGGFPGMFELAAALFSAAEGSTAERHLLARLVARDLERIYDWKRRESAQLAAELGGEPERRAP